MMMMMLLLPMVLLLLPLVVLGERLDDGALVVGRPLQHVIVDHVIQFHFSIKTDKGLRTESWDGLSIVGWETELEISVFYSVLQHFTQSHMI